MSYIVAIETALPKYKHSQDAIIDFYQNSTDDENTKRKIKVIAIKAAIDTRYSVLDDFSKTPNEFNFFPKNRYLEPEPTINVRMALFKKYACDLSLQAVKKIKNFETLKNSITHIITVTCTGLSAPGLDIEIIRELKLNNTIQRSSVNFMGCNAAILALKNADAICRSFEGANVLIVCTELPTIHFQKNYSDDYLLSTSLFGDGCAAILTSSSKPTLHSTIKIKSFYSTILHDGHNEMAWQISDKGFIMNLTSYISQLINGSIKQLLENISVNPNEINYWAVHPGGKKILDDFRIALNLSQDKLKESYSVLSDYGNMSSPTVLFVLKEIIDGNKTNKIGEKIFAAAFGPGLSIETMQLEYV